MTPEGITKKKITALLKKYGAYVYMPVSNGMGMPALDYVVCYRGLFLSVEAKGWETNKTPTERQKNTARNINKAGGTVFMVRDEPTLTLLENWLVVARLIESENSTGPLKGNM